MFPPTSTFWRRFWLLERAPQWSPAVVRHRPELAHLPPTDPYFARWTATRRVLRVLLPQLVVCFALIALVQVCANWILLQAIASLQHRIANNPATAAQAFTWASRIGPAYVLGANVIYLLIALWFGRRASRRLQRAARTELRRRGFPVCLNCGYEAGAIATARCPECGAAHTTA